MKAVISKVLNRTIVFAGFAVIAAGMIRAKGDSPQPVQQAEDGAIKLNAAEVQIKGPNAKLEGGEEKDIIWWTNTDTSLQWKAGIQKAGKYRVELNYSIIGSNNGSELGIAVGNQTVKATPKAGNGLNDYKTGNAGEVTINKAGNYPVILKSLHRGHEFVINVRSVSLVPADSPTPALDITGNAIKQSDDDSIKLSASDAQINGQNAQLESAQGETEKIIGYWKDRDTSVSWAANVQKPGKYRVEMNYSLAPSCEGSKVAITIDNQTLKTRPKPGKNWKDYKVGRAGEVTIDKAGELQVTIRPVSKHQDYVINLRSLNLVPADAPTQAIDIADKPAKPAADGSVKLTVEDSEIDGQTARLEGGDKKYIVWWNSTDSSIQWPVGINKSGTFNVELTYSLAKSNASSEIEISADDQKLAAIVKPGNGLDAFKTEKLGEINLNADKPFLVTLTSTKEPGGLVMHLRSVKLIPLNKK